jgi:hypothetical protein
MKELGSKRPFLLETSPLITIYGQQSLLSVHPSVGGSEARATRLEADRNSF